MCTDVCVCVRVRVRARVHVCEAGSGQGGKGGGRGTTGVAEGGSSAARNKGPAPVFGGRLAFSKVPYIVLLCSLYR